MFMGLGIFNADLRRHLANDRCYSLAFLVIALLFCFADAELRAKRSPRNLNLALKTSTVIRTVPWSAFILQLFCLVFA